MFRDLRTDADGIRRRRRAPPVRRQPRLRRPDDQRRRHDGVGQLLSRCSACSRRSAGCSRRRRQKVGESPVVVLGYAYWTTRFGGKPDVINQTMVVNGQTLTIVGVAPQGFEGTTLGSSPEIFVPITLRGMMEPGFNEFANRRSYWAYVFARLQARASRSSRRAAALNVLYHAVDQRRRSAAPAQHERADDAAIPGEALDGRRRATRARARSTAEASDAAANAARGHRRWCCSSPAPTSPTCCSRAPRRRSGEMAVRLSIGANRAAADPAAADRVADPRGDRRHSRGWSSRNGRST